MREEIQLKQDNDDKLRASNHVKTVIINDCNENTEWTTWKLSHYFILFFPKPIQEFIDDT